MTNDEITGDEYVKFLDSSSTLAERLTGQKFDKNDKRQIKTIAKELIKLNRLIELDKTSTKSFNVYIFDQDDSKRKIMSLEVWTDSLVSNETKESLTEEAERKHKVKDISQLMDYIYDQFKDKSLLIYEKSDNENFSVSNMLTDYTIEQQLPEHEVLRRRIQSIISYCSQHNILDIKQNEAVKDYLGNYMTMILLKALKNPIVQYDYIYNLKLTRYLTKNQYVEFQLILKIVINQLVKQERVLFDRTATLIYEFEQVESALYSYINTQIRKSKSWQMNQQSSQ